MYGPVSWVLTRSDKLIGMLAVGLFYPPRTTGGFRERDNWAIMGVFCYV